MLFLTGIKQAIALLVFPNSKRPETTNEHETPSHCFFSHSHLGCNQLQSGPTA